ncbi:MAG: 2-amino-4-hydroxy-6-hydroxymethyldihydropteridine diphosphokinase [Chloroflexota bacterium]|nr:2-amino-4-hydroxy-6-hydroxymethyldihydropteridine diphosphokinase [Chloroflexota bacterium]
MSVVYLGLGSNLGAREKNLAQALLLLSQKARLERTSSIYETEPVGYSEQPRFLNMACRIRTSLSPRQLLHLAKGIETRMGRVPSFPNAPRPIDIDILLYDNQIMRTEDLAIPHPRLAKRAFALIPLAEIAPKLRHPETGKSIAELLSEMRKHDGVQKWSGGLDVSAIRGRTLRRRTLSAKLPRQM